MRPVTAQWVANAVGGELAADVDARIGSVEKDSRAVTPGALYVAFAGERVDGHDFVTAAHEASATLSLVQRPVDGPHVLVEDVVAALGKLARAYLDLLRTEGELTVIGITGSNGKTTTKDLLAQVLPDAVAPVGSFNNEIGLPLTVLRAEPTTRHLVLEMGASAPGDLAYLTDIAPLDIAVELTVGTAHLGGYGSADALAAEKATLLNGLVDGGVAILNADDARVAAMAGSPALATGGRVIRHFGTERADVDVSARRITVERGRARFHTTIGGEDGPEVALSLVGEHHVTNALAALSVALECGLAPATAAAAVSAAVPLSAHRMALSERADGVWVLDDSYNAAPESMRAALRALKDVATTGRSIAVVGEMRDLGLRAVAAHEEIGLDAVRLRIDRLVVVGEGARAAYVSAVREGSWGDEAVYVATIDEARAFLDGTVERGDTVLIKASHGSGLWQLADDFLGVNT